MTQLLALLLHLAQLPSDGVLGRTTLLVVSSAILLGAHAVGVPLAVLVLLTALGKAAITDSRG